MDKARSQSDEFDSDDRPKSAIRADLHGEQPETTDWMQHLILLRQTAKATLDRLLEYLQRRRPGSSDSPNSSELKQHLAATLESLSARQDSLEAMLHGVGSLGSANQGSADPPSWAVELQAIIANRLAAFEATLLELRLPVAGAEAQDILPAPQPILNDTAIFSQADLSPEPVQFQEVEPEWLQTMLGPTLSYNPKLEGSVGWLEQNVAEGNPEALLLLGQLLVFRFSSPDRKPTILKDLGEAYYRCFPKTHDVYNAFEESLAAWLKMECAEAGLTNSIELVHPGERFDGSRHSPIEKGGVEIAGVLGWVVLREGGRVFSKASVQTR